MSKLWSAIQSHYRPSAAYQVVGRADRGHATRRYRRCRCCRADRATRRRSANAAWSVNPDLLPPCRRCSRRRRRVPAERRAAGRAGHGHRRAAGRRRPRRAAAPPPARRAVRARARLRSTQRRALGHHSRCPTMRRRRAALGGRPAGGRRAPSRRPASPTPRETNAIPLVLAPVPVIAADAGLGLPAATAIRGGVPPRVTVTWRRARRCASSRARRCCSAPPRPVRCAARGAADPLVFEFPDSLAAGDRMGAPARRRRRQRAARPQRPGAGLRRRPAIDGAGMNARPTRRGRASARARAGRSATGNGWSPRSRRLRERDRAARRRRGTPMRPSDATASEPTAATGFTPALRPLRQGVRPVAFRARTAAARRRPGARSTACAQRLRPAIAAPRRARPSRWRWRADRAALGRAVAGCAAAPLAHGRARTRRRSDARRRCGIDERILHFLAGVAATDAALAGMASLVEASPARRR